MYNKLFTKILDSSIWLEPTTTRIVWMTFLAAMDEDGFAQFASVANLAHRARVELPEAESAVKTLESPDHDSSDKEFDGRRIDRVPGGWMVLNAEKYRNLVTREVARERTRLRVAKHRAKKKEEAKSNGGVLLVTPSEAEAYISTEGKSSPKPSRKRDPIFDAIATECGINLAELNKSNGSMIAKSKALILESSPEVSVSDIQFRAEFYRRKFKGAILTPTALSKHWPSLGSDGEENLTKYLP